MILMIALGLFTTLLGVAVGCTVLELTVRALVHSLTDHPVKGVVRPGVGSRWQTHAWE
jgi:hypothetical protein